jgi:hypothetical protein
MGEVRYPCHIYANWKWIRLSNLLRCCTSFPVPLFFIGTLPFICYLYVTSGGPCPRGDSFTLFYSLLQLSFPSVHVLTLLSSLSFTYVETYGNRYLLLFLYLFCPCPFSLDCLQIFLVVVLDLMTRPRRRPYFLFPIVNAFCFPQEGRLHQYPLLCDVDIDGLLSRVVCAFQHLLRVKFEYRRPYSSLLPLKSVRFRDRRHRPVAADDVRKMHLLVEVPFVWRGRRFFLGGGVGPDVPGGGVGCGGCCSSSWSCCAGSMGIYSMKLSSSSSSACAAALFSC